MRLAVDDLLLLADAKTVERGRAYTRAGKVTHLAVAPNEVRAVVEGTYPYEVRIMGSSGECACPVGISGKFCKHCVAVVLALQAEEDLVDEVDSDATRDDAESDPKRTWLLSLPRDELADLLLATAHQFGPAAQFLSQTYMMATSNTTELIAMIEDFLKPRRSFYDYYQANSYVFEGEAVIQSIEDFTEHPSQGLLEAIERAITLEVRVILKSDDSSGGQGDHIHRLLHCHRRVAEGLKDSLDRKEQRRLATWLHKFMFDGKQDFFVINIDEYAQTLGDDGVAFYRGLVDKTAASPRSEEFSFALSYVRQRLAICTHDPQEILAAYGGPPQTQWAALTLVDALDTAGFPHLAVHYATVGLALPAGQHHARLVERLVADAMERGDQVDVLQLRTDHFTITPSTTTFIALRAAARESGGWESRRITAEELLSNRAPYAFLGVLLSEDRNDEAWSFAMETPEAARGWWDTLLDRREQTAPQETLPIYRDLITSLLEASDKRAYASAAQQLVKMRQAAQKAEANDEFNQFMREVAEANRRRPTCMEIFRRRGLIS